MKRVLDDAEIERLVEAFQAEINNGGFHQYFFNASGDEARETLDALETIGAAGAAALLRRACGRFPDGMPPAAWFSRQEVLLDVLSPDAFAEDDEAFYQRNEDLTPIVDRYRSHRS